MHHLWQYRGCSISDGTAILSGASFCANKVNPYRCIPFAIFFLQQSHKDCHSRNMQPDELDALIPDTGSVEIGKIIEAELRRQHRSVTWLGQMIHCDRRNIYDIFSRPSIDTGLLYRISLVLDTNFFRYYSDAFLNQTRKLDNGGG